MIFCFFFIKDRSNCLIEAAKGGHTEIVKLLLEYPKSVTQRTQTVVEALHHDLSNEEGEEEENFDTKKSSPIQLLKNLQKIVPRNILDVLQTGVKESSSSTTDIKTLDNSTYSWTNNDRPLSPDELNQNSDTQQAKKLQILGKIYFSFIFLLIICSLEQLQHVEKELHDKAQQHLKINQEYRQQVKDYVNSNPPPPPPSSSTSSGKKKRTTSSSSTSSSSSATSSTSSTAKHDEQPSLPPTNLTLPIPPQTINFFSTSTNESNQSSSSNNLRISNKSTIPPLHHNQHHPKIKKSFNRQLSKFDRRLEQHLHDNQTHFDEMNLHLKNLKLISPSSNECLTTKIPMRINTDTQKALEHLRELASNPSELERIQTLTNDPNLIHEIKKIANQSFIDQLKTLPPFTPANLQQTNNESLPIDNKPNIENHEQSKRC
jgi:hypothetical protein